MPSFRQKRLPSPAYYQRPSKRPKTHHSTPCAEMYTSAAVPLCLDGDCGARPLTSSQELSGSSQHDQALSRSLQSVHLRPCNASLHDHGAVDYAFPFGNTPSHPRHNATHHAPYISSQSTLPSSSSSSPSPSLPLQPSSQMNYHFGAPTSQSSFSLFPPHAGGSAITNSDAPPYDGDYSALYEGLDTMDSAQHILSSCDSDIFEAADHLSTLGTEFDFDIQPSWSSSPISRSISRSSWDSSSFMDVSSPYSEDYPTPASDTLATTPAPNEADVTALSVDDPETLLWESFSFGTESKTKWEHDLSYVLGSAPLSSNVLTFDLADSPHAAPISASSGGFTARRHSEPANLAAYHFSPFFASRHELPAQIAPGPAHFMTLPIKDNLASSASSDSHSALPSSIAPHQTQLPRPLEIQHPRPVRGFKPPILLSGDHYDPKDFVRRHSEPVLPLRELDIASHLPLDDSQECGDDEVMGDEEEGAFEEKTLEDTSVEEPVGFQRRDMDSWWSFAQDGSIFEPNWSWIRPGSDESPLQGHCLSEGFDCAFGLSSHLPTPLD